MRVAICKKKIYLHIFSRTISTHTMTIIFTWLYVFEWINEKNWNRMKILTRKKTKIERLLKINFGFQFFILDSWFFLLLCLFQIKKRSFFSKKKKNSFNFISILCFKYHYSGFLYLKFLILNSALLLLLLFGLKDKNSKYFFFVELFILIIQTTLSDSFNIPITHQTHQTQTISILPPPVDQTTNQTTKMMTIHSYDEVFSLSRGSIRCNDAHTHTQQPTKLTMFILSYYSMDFFFWPKTWRFSLLAFSCVSA